MKELNARAVVDFHDDARATAPASALWTAIAENHRHNRLLWEEEDLARRRNVSDAEIAANKRNIDRYNQVRNDAIERVDEQLLRLLSAVRPGPHARLHSETPGAMIDRLSILSLRIRQMGLQAARKDVARAHIDACLAKLARLNEQRTDLASCLDRLLAECASGTGHFKVYRQFKMYNDPALNPAIYGESKRSS
jgi:Protein of unknown function (DUF4254)